MHRIGFTFLLLVIGPCAWAQTRWSRQIYNTRIPIVRERRQFSAGDWIPLTQPCPTCRPLTDPLEAGSKHDDIGLVPPKVPRQIQNTGFFPQDESSILSVPPPPSFNNRQPVNYFQFNSNPSPFQPQQFFPPAQQNQFLQPTYLNQPGFFNNPQVPLLFNNPNVVLGQQNDKRLQKPAPAPAVKEPKAPENIVLEQNKRPQQPVPRLELPSPNAPQQFLQQPQTILLNPSQSFLVPQPNKTLSVPQNIEIPGLEKEEIQLLYVPVETLRQRGFAQQQQNQQQQNYQNLQQFNNHHSLPLNQNLVRPPGGHFITQAPSAPPQPQPQPQQTSPITPPTYVLHSLPLEQTPQPFLSASPETQSTQFATAAPLTQEYSPLTTENEPERVVTIPARNPTTQPPSTFFPSTPKPVSNHLTETLTNDVYNDKALTDQKQDFLRSQPIFQTQSTTEVPTTTLAPHQPPLSVFMESDNGEATVVDVLRALKDAKTIPVVDHFTRNTPKVFVGPANLLPPRGYGKFELPYLSNIDTNRVERKVERLPFFVAPLNFNPPPGYSKIPFPAPHIGSVVVSSESSMRSALLHDKGSTSPPEEYDFSSNLPGLNPELPGLINNLETETTTTPLPETTSQRVRSRRPNNAYRPPGRRPIPNSRFRTTTPSESSVLEDSAQNVQNQEILRDIDSEKKERARANYLRRRQRVKTTTEALPENHQTEATYTENAYVPTENHQTQRSDVTEPEQQIRTDDQQQFNQQQFNQQFNQQTDFLSQFDPFQQISSPQPVYHPEQKEVQGIFEVQQQPDFFSVNNNGNTGYFDHTLNTPTEQPISSTQFTDQSSTFSSSTQEPKSEQTSETTKAAEEEITEKTVEIPKQHFRQNLPNVPGVKSVPNPSSVKTKSSVRSRPRGRLTYATSQTTESTTTRRYSNDNENENEQEPTSTRTTSRYNQFYRGTRKPLRTTTESLASTEAHTLRPSRRSGVRTSVSTKRIRKPTTPVPENASEDYDSTDAAFGRKSGSEYSPSGVSNDVYDDQIGHSSIGSKSKKKYESHSFTTPSSASTYQSRKDDDAETKTTYPEWNPSESGLDISGISLTTTPSAEEAAEEKKKQEISKKAFDPELEKKNGRRRIRVRVHKRPHDNFEAAESQNVGTVANVLVPPTPSKPNEEQPDLYRFSNDKDFSFDVSGKFAGTKNKEHVRNITSDILENTFTFSAPGVDNKTELQQKVTIVSEEKTTKTTTEMSSAGESTRRGDDTDKTDVPTTTEIFETTTESFVPETTEPEITTTETPTKVQHSKIIKTSTSTQVSHETEICYKGKCIKTNSESPDKDLKLLVETANLEEEQENKSRT